MSNKRTPAGGPTLNGPIKGQGAGAPPGPNTNSGKNFLEREKRIIQLLNEHVQDRAGKQAYDQIQEELQAKTQESEDLRSQLETLKKEYEEKLSNAEKELATQRGAVQTLFESHEGRIREFDKKSQRDNEQLARLSRAEEEIQALRRELNTINNEKDHFEGQCGQLNSKVEESERAIKKLEWDNGTQNAKIDEQKIKIEVLEHHLTESRKTSRRLTEDLGTSVFERDSIEENFENLATKFHHLVWGTFRDITLGPKDEDIGTPLIDVSGAVLPDIPQVASNSLPARYMRCALAEAVVADTLSALVFSNKSLLVAKLRSNDSDGSANLSPLVTGIELLSTRGYPLEATIIQWQVVKVCQHLNASQKIASKATDRVCEILDPWFGEGSSATHNVKDTFAGQLDGLFTEAAELWQLLQRTRKNARVAVGAVRGQWDYLDDSWPEYNEIEKPSPKMTEDGALAGQDDEHARRRWSSGHPTTTPIAPLFPQIQAKTNLSNQPDDNIIFHGYALFPMQPVVLAAWEEQKRRMGTTPPPMTRRLSGVSKRRYSRVERATAPMLRDDQGQGPSHQAETNRSSGAASAPKSNVTRRLSIHSQTGTMPLQQRSTVSDSDRASSTVSSSRRSRRDEKGPPNPTMSESSNRGRRSGTVESGDRGNG